MDLKITETNTKFANAFIKVAEMLEPNAEFTAININKKIHEKGINVFYVVSGDMVTENGITINVVVATEKKPIEGKQIVVRYYLNDGTHYLETRTRSYWFYSFNWKGLMATTKIEEND